MANDRRNTRSSSISMLTDGSSCRFDNDYDQESMSLHSAQAHERSVTSGRFRRVWMLTIPVAHRLNTRRVSPSLRCLVLVS